MGDHRSDNGAAPELTRLFQEHAPGLAGAVRNILGRPEEVEEVLQEGFLKAWRAWEGGPPRSNAKAWLFVLVMNLARDRSRQRRRRPATASLSSGEIMEPTSTRPGPMEDLVQAETLAAAREAIHTLAPTEREVFLLRTSAGLTFAALAKALAIPEGTAKTRMRAALAHLRTRLATIGREPMEGRKSS